MFADPLFLLAGAIGFYMAWNIGANDVANAFGCSVGSGALTFRRALILAAIFEFSGAFFAGSHVTDTIRGNIVFPELFAASPRDFAIGMMAAMLASSIWLNVATSMGQPVSTTHAIIGAVIGFGIAAHGPGCVQWFKLIRIASSWLISPLVGSCMSFTLYLAIRRYVLRHPHPVAGARVAVPLAFGGVCAVLSFTVMQYLFVRFWPEAGPQGGRLAGGLAILIWIFVALGGWLILRRRLILPDDPAAESPLVERCFGRLQIVNACYISFAHGANDVANAMGPVLGVFYAFQGVISSSAPVPSWILVFGGVGIVAGLATYGYKVIESIGKKITEVTPTRGFAADFSTASTVLVCSLMGLPISTTFVLVGAVMGVGLARGFGAIDLQVVRRIFMSWLVTIPISAIGTAVIYRVMRLIWE